MTNVNKKEYKVLVNSLTGHYYTMIVLADSENSVYYHCRANGIPALLYKEISEFDAKLDWYIKQNNLEKRKIINTDEVRVANCN
jgi:peptide methionine sulfoxide reductase MsrB